MVLCMVFSHQHDGTVDESGTARIICRVLTIGLEFVISRLVAEMDYILKISMREISPRDSDPGVAREY